MSNESEKKPAAAPADDTNTPNDGPVDDEMPKPKRKRKTVEVQQLEILGKLRFGGRRAESVLVGAGSEVTAIKPAQVHGVHGYRVETKTGTWCFIPSTAVLAVLT